MEPTISTTVAAALSHSVACWPDAWRDWASPLVWLMLTLLSLWAMAALYIDVRLSALRLPLTILYAVLLVAILAEVQTASSVDAVMLRMFLPGARLVAEV